jgi:hypothetical protein
MPPMRAVLLLLLAALVPAAASAQLADAPGTRDHPMIKRYDGSWTEWGNLVGMPIETGEGVHAPVGAR